LRAAYVTIRDPTVIGTIVTPVVVIFIGGTIIDPVDALSVLAQGVRVAGAARGIEQCRAGLGARRTRWIAFIGALVLVIDAGAVVTELPLCRATLAPRAGAVLLARITRRIAVVGASEAFGHTLPGGTELEPRRITRLRARVALLHAGFATLGAAALTR
jgi:hypothetical protein